MIYLAIYTVFMLAVGFVFGVAIERRLNKADAREIIEENRKMHREIAQLRKHEVIEIVDHRAEPKSYFEPF